MFEWSLGLLWLLEFSRMIINCYDLRGLFFMHIARPFREIPRCKSTIINSFECHAIHKWRFSVSRCLTVFYVSGLLVQSSSHTWKCTSILLDVMNINAVYFVANANNRRLFSIQFIMSVVSASVWIYFDCMARIELIIIFSTPLLLFFFGFWNRTLLTCLHKFALWGTVKKCCFSRSTKPWCTHVTLNMEK